jgi:hypothetical protein
MVSYVARLSACLAAVLTLRAPALSADAPGPEGNYACGPVERLQVRLGKPNVDGAVEGRLLAEGEETHKKLVGQVVLELRRSGEREYRGRVRAILLKASRNPGVWVKVPKAELLENGDLRLTVQVDKEATAAVVWRRVKEPASAPPPAPDAAPDLGAVAERMAGELAGAWQTPQGGVIHYAGFRDSYVGQVAKLSPSLEEHGFKLGEEAVRVTRTAPGIYKGTVKTKNRKGERAWWDDATITVRGDRLACVRRPKGTDIESREPAVRLGSTGTPAAELVPTRDEGDLAGTWRDQHGAVVRYAAASETDYVGTIVRLSPRNEGYGFRTGEEGVRLKRTGQFAYRGQVLVKSEGGREAWWEDLEAVVHADSLRYTRRLRHGGTEENTAARVPEEKKEK